MLYPSNLVTYNYATSGGPRVLKSLPQGQSINDVTLLGGGHTFLTMRDEGEGGGLKKCDVTSKG